jgi:hypothetical protein
MKAKRIRIEKKKESEARYKQMMRTQLFHQACESLTTEEVKQAMVNGAILKYIHTTLDEKGVPVDAGIKELKVSNLDIKRLESILKYKESREEQLNNTKI